MKKYLLSLGLLILFACKDKKAPLQAGDIVTAADFVAFYPEVTLPYIIADTMLVKKSNDSMALGLTTFSKFIPDSIWRKDFGKNATPKFYALARTAEKEKEHYLFTKVTAGSKRVVYLACFSKDNKFLKAMPLLKTGFEHYTSAYGLLDSKFQITTYRETKKAGGDVLFKRNIYFYDRNGDNFTLIVTEPNEDIIQDVQNPIDTMSAKNKFSGDYVENDRNFVSVRDGRNASEMVFFVHFEKNGGKCIGELKGTARFISPTVAQFVKSDNPCSLEFLFAGNKITMKEKGGCGSYRDIQCFFSGSYWKKKASKPKKK
ncbi:hypothetical protein FAM09_09380 [Niastella caeni]|uniref:Lipoprotein n=1 Tax=Niastella caeni TaxID=2569763 RepID=A0A4V4H1D7_9BACT|nr:hypothetical protein [Niastella caeni]THU40086.1 hypothetical protein FAM09_09380 [Niastella caeni]